MKPCVCTASKQIICASSVFFTVCSAVYLWLRVMFWDMTLHHWVSFRGTKCLQNIDNQVPSQAVSYPRTREYLYNLHYIPYYTCI